MARCWLNSTGLSHKPFTTANIICSINSSIPSIFCVSSMMIKMAESELALVDTIQVEGTCTDQGNVNVYTDLIENSLHRALV